MPRQSGDSPSGRPRATALTAASALIRALGLEAGQVTITVQFPSKIALVDVSKRLKGEELDTLALAGVTD